MIRHWFFDFDGTLADTDRDVREAWKAAFGDVGLECADFDRRFRNGPPLDRVLAELFPDAPPAADAVRERFKAHYDGDGFPHTAAYGGVGGLLGRLKELGAALYVASNKRLRPLGMLLDKLGWTPLFSGVFTPDAVAGERLAKPEFLARAIRSLGIRPAEAAMVGDTPADVEAGRACGLFTVGCRWGYADAGAMAAAGADLTVGLEDLERLPDLVRQPRTVPARQPAATPNA